MKIYQLFRKVY